MPDLLEELQATIDGLIDDQAEQWDRAGAIPEIVLRKLADGGLLCPEVPARFGGLGLSSSDGGPFTAHVGSRCSSLRSVMTSQGMAAWTIHRMGSAAQHEDYLTRLATGQLAAVAFSEPDVGSDLSTMGTWIRHEGDEVVLDGLKVWTTAAAYADLVVVIGMDEAGGAAAAVVPVRTPGVTIVPVVGPSGCRAAGHSDVRLEGVRLPASAVLGGGGHPLSLLCTTALAYGRLSVAWGCVGILRACLTAAVAHATTRRQFGKPLSEHQLVARHLAELFCDEQSATRACEHASRCWDVNSADQVIATVLAKYVSARAAARGSSAAVQVLGSAAAREGHVVERAHRDAKLMEVIEGSNEIGQLALAQYVVAGRR